MVRSGFLGSCPMSCPLNSTMWAAATASRSWLVTVCIGSRTSIGRPFPKYSTSCAVVSPYRLEASTVGRGKPMPFARTRSVCSVWYWIRLAEAMICPPTVRIVRTGWLTSAPTLPPVLLKVNGASSGSHSPPVYFRVIVLSGSPSALA